jgi:hypothetical protein
MIDRQIDDYLRRLARNEAEYGAAKVLLTRRMGNRTPKEYCYQVASTVANEVRRAKQ